VVSIFRVSSVSQAINRHGADSKESLVLTLTLKKEEEHSSKISVHFYHNIRRHVPEDSTLLSHRCEKLKFNEILIEVSASR
jgi:hypothetical protein